MQNYSFAQQLLHDLILDNQFIKKSFYELEKALYLKKSDVVSNQHVFITGLPRSGTTMLLNMIYSSNEFASLRYLDMPFIITPNFSKLFHSKNSKVKKERLHQDGIMFDLESPEAFDEAFFSTFNAEEIKSELENYINLILLSQDKKRYLSKNNLNYKRVDVIQSIFSNAIFLMPIREPLQHAHSLFKMHVHFNKLQEKDPFMRRYMHYLGHHEFGLDHQYWNEPQQYANSLSLDYWLEQWILFYENLYKQYYQNTQCKFIVYEKLPKAEVRFNLEKLLSISMKKDVIFKNCNKNIINKEYSKSLYEKAVDLYLYFESEFSLN